MSVDRSALIRSRKCFDREFVRDFGAEECLYARGFSQSARGTALELEGRVYLNIKRHMSATVSLVLLIDLDL